MGELWEANVTVISACIQKSGVDPSDILGIGCTGHGKGLYLVDSTGAPAYYGIPSTDARAESVIEAWEASGVSDGLMEMTLHRPVACQPLPLLAWLKENEPEAYTRIRYIFEAKDYIRFCLTGEAYAVDGSTRPQACHLGHLGSHPTAYIVGIAQRRKLTIKLGHSHRLADAGVEVLSHQIHQTAPRIIGDFRVSLPR